MNLIYLKIGELGLRSSIETIKELYKIFLNNDPALDDNKQKS